MDLLQTKHEIPPSPRMGIQRRITKYDFRIPTIVRKNKTLTTEQLLTHERCLLKKFWEKSSNVLRSFLNTNEDDSTNSFLIKLMPLAQHCGLHTRLLDWTEDFHVALWVAACEDPNENGYIYAFHQGDFEEALANYWEANNVEMMPDGSGQRNWVRHCFEVTSSVGAPFITKVHYQRDFPRMAAQSGFFTIANNITFSHDDFILEYHKSHPPICFEIPSALKIDLLMWLQSRGINSELLRLNTLDKITADINTSNINHCSPLQGTSSPPLRS